MLLSEPCYVFLQIKAGYFLEMHMAFNDILLYPITSRIINKMCYFMINCINGHFVFLVGWGRGGICMCMRFRIYFSNILESNTLSTSDLFTCTCCVLMSKCV